MRWGVVLPWLIVLVAMPLLFVSGRMSARPPSASVPPLSERQEAVSAWPVPYVWSSANSRAPIQPGELPLHFDRIELERAGCFWGCPVYTATLWRDGRASYSGYRNARRTGGFQGRVDALSYGWLCYLIEESHFDRLESDYSANATDLETTIVRVWPGTGGQPIVVRDYGDAGPINLWGLRREIDAIVDEITWTPSAGDLGK